MRHRFRMLTNLPLVATALLLLLALLSGMARADTTNISIQIVSSNATDGVALEIISTDKSRLASSGLYTIHARVRGATYLTMTINNIEADTKSVTDDGEWQDVMFTVSLANPGSYLIVLSASDIDTATSVDQTITINYLLDNDNAGGEYNTTNAKGSIISPNTGQGFFEQSKRQWWMWILLPMTALGVMVVILAKKKRGKTAHSRDARG